MLYINVPYSEKEEAKELGARWNPAKKSWYVTQRAFYDKFYKWILGDKEDVTILYNHFYIVEGKRVCYRCNRETKVIGFGIEKYCTLYNPQDYKNSRVWDDGEIHIASFIEPLDAKLLLYLNNRYGYHMGYSQTAGGSYLANHCKHCKALQGDYFLFQEVDSPFFIDSVEAAKNLKLYKVKLVNDMIADIGMSWGSEDYLIKKYAQRMGDVCLR